MNESTVRLRYPIKIAGKLYPADMEVRLATDEEIKQEWPAMTRDSNSTQVGVWFPDMPHLTIVHSTQIKRKQQ